MIYLKYSWLEDGCLERLSESHIGGPLQWQMAMFPLQRNAAHPAWPQGVSMACVSCLAESVQCSPSKAQARHCPMIVDALQVPCPQTQAGSFPYMNLLFAASSEPSPYCSLFHSLQFIFFILILVFNFRFDLQDHFPINDPGSFNNSFSLP